MRIGNFDLDQHILVVAEIGNNHEGSISLAEELIGRAAEAGVGAVKFQTFRTEDYISPGDAERFCRLRSFELRYEQFERLSEVARQNGVIFFSTPFDLQSAEALNPFVPAFKISSGDNTFYPLLETIARFGKPIILSTGLANLARIRYAKALVERVWSESGVQQNLALLHCVSSYPVPFQEASLGAIRALGNEFHCTVGYSDHCTGINAAALSVALGARIVEKHFTLDKNYSSLRDHHLSADPGEMSELVQRINHFVSLIGAQEKHPQPCEMKIASSVRRSIAAKRDIAKGAVVSWNDITWTRPGGGLSPGNEQMVLGKALASPVRRGEMILPQMLVEAKSE